MKKDNKNAVIIALLVTIAFMSVGYALLSAEIDNNQMKTSITDAKRKNIKITTITSIETIGNAEDTKSFISNENEVTMYPRLLEFGDTIIYTINIKNDGNIDEVLNSIEVEADDSIAYVIDNLSAGDIVTAGDSKIFTISLSLNEEYVGQVNDKLPEVKIKLNF